MEWEDKLTGPGRDDGPVWKEENEEGKGIEVEVDGSAVYDEILAEGRGTGTGGQAINLPLIASSDETGASKSLRASTDLKIKI